MSKIITIVTTILFLLISVGNIYASEEAILFWGTTCPHCHAVREEIEKRGWNEGLDIEELEIYENRDNLETFKEKIGICGINVNRAGVPMLFMEGKCYMGKDPIIEKLADFFGESVEGEQTDSVEKVPVSNNEGKKNTEIMIIGGIVGLALLVALGYILKGKGANMFVASLLVTSLFLANTSGANAMCPVCTVAVGAGLGLSRYLGIDDTITGAWIGGLIVSSIMWLINWLKTKNIKGWIPMILSTVLMYGTLFLTLYLMDVVGHPLNQIYGIDKIVFGIVLGSITFFLFAKFHLYLKSKNNDKVLFPFQKVVITVGSLVLLTFALYLLVY